MTNFDLLRQKLEHIERQYDSSGEVQNDPIHLAMKFKDPKDLEVVAFICSVFSYGNVKQISNSLNQVFNIIGDQPCVTIKTHTQKDWLKIIPKNFKHRFNDAHDLSVLLTWLGQALRASGTLENFFLETYDPQDFEKSMNSFVERLTHKPKSKSAQFFVPKPADKSACKRLMLFMRWMCGQSPMDLNLWKKIDRAQLLIPVDTHVLRISRHLGLTKRKDTSWRTAQEITRQLKNLDPQDPTRFDFALCHLGISQECPSRYSIKICHQCQMNTLCVTYNRHIFS